MFLRFLGQKLLMERVNTYVLHSQKNKPNIIHIYVYVCVCVCVYIYIYIYIYICLLNS